MQLGLCTAVSCLALGFFVFREKCNSSLIDTQAGFLLFVFDFCLFYFVLFMAEANARSCEWSCGLAQYNCVLYTGVSDAGWC